MAVDERPAAGVDVFDPHVYAEGMPYDRLATLRKHRPVAWHAEHEVLGWSAGPGFWAVTRHHDVTSVSRTPQLFSAQLGGTQIRDPDTPEDLTFVQRMMLNMDPPEHSRLRAILNQGFTPRNVSRLEPVIRGHCQRLVDEIATRGECDFAEDFGAKLPLLVLADVMGVPPSDAHLLYEWTNRIIGYQDDEYAQPVDPDTGRPLNPRSREALADMFDYAHELAEHKRAHPADDLITKLLEAEVDGERITTEEFENMFFLFTVAGNDTTHSSIPGGMLALLEHPAERQRLLTDPGLLPGAIEEMLRYAPPVIHFRRTATRDCRLRDVPIAAGEKVVVFYASANRDEEVFDDPDRFDITRRASRHVTFGVGPHFCLGNVLARLQMRVAFSELLWRLPDMEPAGPVERLQSNFINGLKRMPVRFTPEPA
ncbi:MAG: cytochrome P450 [Actinomycetota bacterium]|nr:cytochrome P450 [Actinomycetota bacterium]